MLIDRNTICDCWRMHTHTWDSSSERTIRDWTFTIALIFWIAPVAMVTRNALRSHRRNSHYGQRPQTSKRPGNEHIFRNGESLIFYRFAWHRVPVNIRPVVYCTAVRESTDSKEWDHLWNAFKATNVAAEQRVIMEALGCTKNADVLKVIVNSIPVDEISECISNSIHFRNIWILFWPMTFEFKINNLHLARHSMMWIT